MKVRITNDTMLGNDTKVMTEDGKSLTHLLDVTEINIGVDKAVKATGTFFVDGFDIKAELEFDGETKALLRRMGWEYKE